MKILVTGGAGYIGSHTCVELLNAGYDIVVLDNLSNSSPKAIEAIKRITKRDFTFYHTDLLNIEELYKIFASNPIEAVIHFAGLKSVSESTQVPLLYYENNLTGTINLLKTMLKFDVKTFIFSSSATVYGDNEHVPLAEEENKGDQIVTSNPYGTTKLFIERVLQDVQKAHRNFSITILRYFNPIGAHKSGEIGEDPNGIPNNLLPYISQVAVGKLDKLHIFGNDYPTKDGTGVRDYIHVVDLALGHIKALEHCKDKAGVHTYNLGTGRGYSVLEVLGAFEKACGRQIPYIVDARRPGDVATSYANPSKANKELSWIATRGLDEMCSDAWRWQQLHPHGFNTD